MTDFKRYTHLERFGNDEVQGIELGTCYIFPKIDGTNSSVWLDQNGKVQAGSRNRHLTIEADNAGFYAHIKDQENIKAFLKDYAGHRLYGEWLVPHSLKTYRDEAWRRFYVFDVYNDTAERYLPFDMFESVLKSYNIDFVPCMAKIKNASYDNLLHELDKNRFLIKDGEGPGEGIVIKNYDFQNKFGRMVFAKLVTNSFKEKHVKEMGGSFYENKLVEQEVCNDIVDKHLIDKVYAKIVNEAGGWSSKYIPRLLSTVYHDAVTEELWSALKRHKSPIVNFKTLNKLCILKTKELRPELF